jgi:hypothetical protein
LSRNSRIDSISGSCARIDGINAAGNQSEIVDNAIALYGADAPTAAAYCALDAWCEGDRDEYRLWLDIFRRLRN